MWGCVKHYNKISHGPPFKSLIFWVGVVIEKYKTQEQDEPGESSLYVQSISICIRGYSIFFTKQLLDQICFLRKKIYRSRDNTKREREQDILQEHPKGTRNKSWINSW